MRVNPLLVSAGARALERAFTTALRYDPGTRAAIAQLDGQIIALECSAPDFIVYLCGEQGTLRVRAACYEPPHCIVRGRGVDLATLLLAEDTHSFANTGVQVSGQPQLLAQLQKILQQLDIDWEEPLNEVLGDVAGHQVAEALRAPANWVNRARKKLPIFTADYLAEELRAVPSKLEVQGFLYDVDTIRADAERLQARLNKLKKFITH